MALIVEDGSIVPGAESYATVAYADDYFTKRGNAVWAALASEPLKEVALRQATDYMIVVYRDMWQGQRVAAEQVLDWPRYNVYRDGLYIVPSDIVPDEVQRACCELAVRATTGELLQDQTSSIVREKVGPIETQYAAGQNTQTAYTFVNNLLAPFLSGGGAGQGRLVRA